MRSLDDAEYESLCLLERWFHTSENEMIRRYSALLLADNRRLTPEGMKAILKCMEDPKDDRGRALVTMISIWHTSDVGKETVEVAARAFYEYRHRSAVITSQVSTLNSSFA